MELYFIVGLISLIVFIALFIYKDKKIGILFLGFEITNFFLVLPLYNNYNSISKIVYSIVFALKSLGLGQDIKLIGSIELNSTLNYLYVILMYSLAFVGPIITAGVLFTIISKFYGNFKLLFNKNKNIHLFNEINERTICLGKKIRKESKNDLIIYFSNNNISEIKNMNGIIMNYNINAFNINKFKGNITYYYFNDIEEYNTNNVIELIDKCKKKIKIYLLISKVENILVIDSKIRQSNKNIEIEVIDEAERESLRVLDSTPLYLESVNKDLSILIVGCGYYGNEFLKNITHVGQIYGYNLIINVIDICADDIKNKLSQTCPELLNNYNINFIRDDINNGSIFEALNNIKNINYVIVSCGNDELNLHAGIFLRTYFIKINKNFKRMPIINLNIKDEYKKNEINKLINNNIEFNKNIKDLTKDNFFNFNTFGNLYDMYYSDSIINSKIEKMAKKIHLIYDANDKDLINFYGSEYNKKSSRAIAAHIKYKLYSVLGNDYKQLFIDNNYDELIKIYNDKLNDNIIDILAENEHNRWVSYMRSIGYEKESIDDAIKCKKDINSYTNKLAKLHPAIIPYKELDKISIKLNKDYKVNNVKLIKNLDKILDVCNNKK